MTIDNCFENFAQEKTSKREMIEDQKEKRERRGLCSR